jgi:hypothetical protein
MIQVLGTSTIPTTRRRPVINTEGYSRGTIEM